MKEYGGKKRKRGYMENKYNLKHIGINLDNENDANYLSNLLSKMFNLQPRGGKKSEFAGDIFECMKSSYLGEKGHIALETEDLESAVLELRSKGFDFLDETKSYNKNGKLSNIYLSGEFGGFAIHIMQRK